jgi:N-acyl-D-amino-acid deacylase
MRAGALSARGGLTLRLALLAAAVGAVAALVAARTPDRFDLAVLGGQLVDGSGAPGFQADIGIRAGRIARIGRISRQAAASVLDARGRVVAPGFIDVHMHVEEELAQRPGAESLVADGVTTIVTGNCGGSELRLADWFGRLAHRATAINVASLVGHNAVRRAVLGGANRSATPREMAEMEALLRRGLQEGAVGFSTGLIYPPGTFAPASEVTALARVAARFGGVYATHLRSENEKVFEAIAEAIAAARDAGLPLQISHFKVTSRRLRGSSTRMLEAVERARAQGLDVTLDQYPYTASSSGLEVLLPDWALEAGDEGARTALRRRLAQPALRRRMALEMHHRIQRVLGRDHLDYAVVSRFAPDPSLEGKNLREIHRARRRPGGRGAADGLRGEITTALELCAQGASRTEGAGACGVQMIYHVLDEGDVQRIFRHSLTMVARDGGLPELGVGKPHPRSYGTAARVLGRFVRELRLVPLEEAIRKMTSLPAQRFGFRDRGLLREGFQADLVVFDPRRVTDAATFEDPHRPSEGIDDVLVNGAPVRRGGRATGKRPGRILLGAGRSPARATAGRALPLSAAALRAFRR